MTTDEIRDTLRDIGLALFGGPADCDPPRAAYMLGQLSARLGADPAYTYTGLIVELKSRILALIPERPEILVLPSVWHLFKVPGFDCSDLKPSLAQATDAWREACREHRAKGRPQP